MCIEIIIKNNIYINRNQWGNDWSKQSQYKTGNEMRIAKLPRQSNNCGISTYAMVPLLT